MTSCGIFAIHSTFLQVSQRISLHYFTFNPFSENTYLMFNDSGEAVVIDPGMSNITEQQLFLKAIEERSLKVVALFNTHGHIDHIMGNAFVKERFKVPFYAHEKCAETIAMGVSVASMYGLHYDPSPAPDHFITEETGFQFGDRQLEVRFVPGHAPGHLALVCHEERLVIAGDVLFKGSVGRVDLPGGDGAELARSIQEKMYTLPEDYRVFCGHGPATTIGEERRSNPFVREGYSAF